MKAPKNFYNTVDQTKLGIDDLFTRTAENEADITALETVVGDDTAGLVKSVSDLETVVGDDTTGLVKSVNDLETVVGDLDGGLVKDVHDLQDDSEHYHDDIADLKTADITIGNQIAELEADIDGHLLADVTSADEGKIMSVDSTGAWALTTPAGGGSNVLIIEAGLNPDTHYLTFSKTIGEINSDIRAAVNDGKDVIIICKSTTGTPAVEVFRIANQDNNYTYFTEVLRTASATIYKNLDIRSFGGSTGQMFSTKTINDPT